ncbi:MAG: hypothetical protein KBA33_08275 [Cloacibacterium sp.]|nr:hypothetical protein [Cloacibacterium sp.]
MNTTKVIKKLTKIQWFKTIKIENNEVAVTLGESISDNVLNKINEAFNKEYRKDMKVENGKIVLTISKPFGFIGGMDLSRYPFSRSMFTREYFNTPK